MFVFLGKRWNRKSLEVKTPPATLAIPLATVKLHLRVDGTDEDTTITMYINAATKAVENYLNRSLINQTLIMRLDGVNQVDDAICDVSGFHGAFPEHLIGRSNDYLQLWKPVVQSVTSLTTYDVDNSPTVFDSSSYQIDKQGGRLFLNVGEVWPTNIRERNGVEIEYVAGYGAASTDIPDDILMGILMQVEALYNRCDPCGITPACKDLISPYRFLADAM